MEHKKENIILDQNKTILDLKKELEEKSNFIWLIGEIIKHSGNLQSESELAYLITDMLIGIFGFKQCALRIKQENEKYNIYIISNNTKNRFKVIKNKKLEDKYLNLNSTEIEKKQNESNILAPIFDYKNNENIGYLSASHYQKDFFSKTKKEFFNTLTIQLSNVLINSKLYRKVAKLSNKDILTNCLNRRYLDDLMDYNNSKYITYIIFDLDNFKMVNDNYGHQKGDELLVQIADKAINFFNEYNGKVIRYGGDEFIVILELKLEKGKNILKTFKDELTNSQLLQQFPFKVSASFGMANYPKHSLNLNDLLKKADKALYHSKTNGKNQISIYKNKSNYSIKSR